MRTLVAAVLVCGAMSWPAGAGAQGKGNAFGRAKTTRPPAPATAGSSAPASASLPLGAGPEVQAANAGFRHFGSWLDDAVSLPAGQGYLSVGFGLWRRPGYREIDLPALDTAVGVHERVQFGATLPYYHANEPGGPVMRGVGTAYLTGKVQLRSPSSGGLGISVSPALEVLSSAPAGAGRVGLAVPVNVEIQRRGWRTYASTGFFTRGALFASGALEAALSDRLWLTGTVSRSYSAREDPLSTALGLPRSRTDVSGGAAFAVTPAIALYGSAGRAIAAHGDSSLAFAGGVSVSFAVR